MNRKNKRVILFFILMVTGFLVAFSYQYANADKAGSLPVNTEQWKKENDLRNSIIDQQKANRELQKDLEQKRDTLRKIEEKLADQEKITYNLVEELNKFRKVLGKEKVKGSGIIVTLSDSEYIPDGKNPNNYIVHEQHIQAVIYEMFVTGAEAVAVNGQRISGDSYIQCVGPVVKVNGRRYPAPFVITAIGNPETMNSALTLAGNTQEQLVQQGIEVKIQTKSNIEMNPYYAQKG
jgi:uncharacterized protein YlxW (UPF0749 family)